MVEIEKTSLFRMAMSACGDKSYKTAIQYYDDLEKGYPDSIILFNNRGRAKVHLGIEGKSLTNITAGIKDLLKANSLSDKENGEDFVNLSLKFGMEELGKLLDEYFKNFPDLTYTVSSEDDQELVLYLIAKAGFYLEQYKHEGVEISTYLHAQGFKYIRGQFD